MELTIDADFTLVFATNNRGEHRKDDVQKRGDMIEKQHILEGLS